MNNEEKEKLVSLMIPKGLHQKIRIEAARERKSMKDLSVHLLTEGLRKLKNK